MIDKASTTPERPTSSPVSLSTFPSDLLYIIFCLTTDSGASSPTTTATSLSHVCQSWRNVSLGSPALWRIIEVDRIFAEHPSSANSHKVWLHRSQDLNLSIRIWPHSSHLSSDSTLRLWRTLFPSIHRWKELTIIGLGLLQSHSFLAMVQHCPSSLVKLRVSPSQKEGTTTIVALRLPPTPMLEYLEIDGRIAELSDEWLRQSVRLRELHLDYTRHPPPRLRHIYDILSLTSTHLQILQIIPREALVSDVVSSAIHDTGSLSGVPKLQLPHLIKLRLSSSIFNQPLNPLWQKICAPCLSIIDAVAARDLSDLVEQNQFSGLNRLSVVDIDGRFAIRGGEFFRWFSQLANLQAVIFYDFKWRPSDAAYVVLSQCCSKLVEVTFEKCARVGSEDLRKVVESRIASADLRSLESLHLVKCRSFKLEDREKAWFMEHLNVFEIAWCSA